MGWNWFSQTDSCPVLSHQPQMVAEKRHDADKEQGGHKEEEEDVELGVFVRELVLQRGVKTKIYIRLLSQKSSSLGDKSVFE